MATNVRSVFVMAEFECSRCDEPHLQATTAPLDDDGRVTQNAVRPHGTLLCPKCVTIAGRHPESWPPEKKPKPQPVESGA